MKNAGPAPFLFACWDHGHIHLSHRSTLCSRLSDTASSCQAYLVRLGGTCRSLSPLCVLLCCAVRLGTHCTAFCGPMLLHCYGLDMMTVSAL